MRLPPRWLSLARSLNTSQNNNVVWRLCVSRAANKAQEGILTAFSFPQVRTRPSCRLALGLLPATEFNHHIRLASSLARRHCRHSISLWWGYLIECFAFSILLTGKAEWMLFMRNCTIKKERSERMAASSLWVWICLIANSRQAHNTQSVWKRENMKSEKESEIHFCHHQHYHACLLLAVCGCWNTEMYVY